MSDNLNSAFKNNLPPRSAATDPGFAIYRNTTALGAVAVDLWTAYTGPDGSLGAPNGKVWIELEVYAFPVWVRFARTGTVLTTRENGYYIPEGAKAKFYIDPTIDRFLDVYTAGGAAEVKYRLCSTIAERSRQ